MLRFDIWSDWIRRLQGHTPHARTGHRRDLASPNVAAQSLESRVVPTVNITNGAHFAVTVNGSENVSIGVSGGNVKVTVDGTVTVAQTKASDVTRLTVQANGNFANVLNLSEVTKPNFPLLKRVSINGGDGNDTITGSTRNDVIDGGAGDDFIKGGAGSDSILGGGGNDKSLGGSGNDTISGGVGNDTSGGQAGDDALIGDEGNDKLDGGIGTDTIKAEGFDSYKLIVDQSTGNGTLRPADVISAGIGRDKVYGVEAAELTGNSNANLIKVSGLIRATLNGLGGDDTLTAIGNRSRNAVTALNGGEGNDYLASAPYGTDASIDGGAGDDVVRAGVLGGTFGGGQFFGGSGRDELMANVADTRTDLTDTALTFYSGAIVAPVSSFEVVKLFTPNYSDGVKIDASAFLGDVELVGGDQRVGTGDGDTLIGGRGNDTLTGYGGNDSLIGNAGTDILTGNDGRDFLIWRNGDHDVLNADGHDITRQQ